ncbi:MAG: glycosyltransferase family 2 protein [Patescibacteria group bacterium]
MLNNTPEISIIITTWNSIKYLPALFNSIQIQTKRNFEIIVVDNCSSDNSALWIRNNYPDAKMVVNSSNLGFAKANNQGIKIAKAPFIVLCNADIIMSKSFLEDLYNGIMVNDKIGSVGGKLMKINADLNSVNDSVTIDSTGIAFNRSRRATDRGENEKDHGQYNGSEEVFGISAALVMYRKSALEDVAEDGQYLDESFFSYKEDIDLAWRLRLAGYISVYISEALAFHARGIARKTDLSDRGTIKNRKGKNPKANYLSYRNHMFLLAKNESLKNIFLNPFLLWYEFKKFIYLLFREPLSLYAIINFYFSLPKLMNKRRKIKKHMKIKREDIIKYFR